MHSPLSITGTITLYAEAYNHDSHCNLGWKLEFILTAIDLSFFNLLGLKKMSSSTGWYSLAQAQLKMHRYSDSATSCSQGILLSTVYHCRHPDDLTPASNYRPRITI